MSKPLLSILIPTVVDRDAQYKILKRKIYEQTYANHDWLTEIVEILSLSDNKEMTIGEKRERLYKKAIGDFSWQIDDDDSIADDAISLILQAIKENSGVDCVTFRENCMMNGEYKSSNHSLKYDDWADNVDGYDFVRTPFYKDVIKTEIAKSVPFEKIRYGEDHAWARALKPHLKTEYHIDKEIYYYCYEPKDTHNERYGIV